MDFTFSEDQLLFRDSVRDFLSNEVTTESIRERWESETGRSDVCWQSLAELGLTAMLVPEEQGGLGMDVIDFVLLAEECGRAALPEALVDNVLVATPLLVASAAAESNSWLEQLAAGELQISLSQGENLLSDAHVSQLAIIDNGEQILAVETDKLSLSAQESVDPSRRLFSYDWDGQGGVELFSGEEAAQQRQALRNRGALGAAAQLLGLAQRMTELSVNYTSERKQFGVAIGTFQAVKHHMANVAVATEFAKAPVYRAAYSVAHDDDAAAAHVAQAKIAASQAALLAAKSGIQVHGAMGYTWEVDMHIFMKRAWALDGAWGTRAQHKACVANSIFAADAKLGAGATFAA
jgi:alkylation response protein AidB-like acyl-CoA dehydrogenase